MDIPLPVDDGWSHVATCQTRRELIELLAGLLWEPGEPEAGGSVRSRLRRYPWPDDDYSAADRPLLAVARRA
jgi:hypothetical protein